MEHLKFFFHTNWRKENSSKAEKLIEDLTSKLDEAQEDENIDTPEITDLKWKLCDAFREEEIFWKQKSRALWLKEGDRNTKFFHATTKQRRAKNKILGILNQDGVWVEKEEEILLAATNYFSNLFTSSTPSSLVEAVRDVPELISDVMNTQLLSVITEAEVKKAVFQMNPEKTPGPDGMTTLFYQKFWDVTGANLVALVRQFFETGEFDPGLNATNICLIPKKSRPREMLEFRPISLCNVVYKVISKVLSNRLKRLLPKIISETQSAFVSGRLITDNILIAQENFHALRTNSSCRKKFMAVKTDMSKAYDRVEWDFLHSLMIKLGFSLRWTNLVMYCIRSVTYQVIINGEAKGSIKPTRGIRQGDPLSPYLFIICTEGLIAQLKHAEWFGKIQGMQISRASPLVSHLLFADDSLLFCKAEENQSKEIIDILRLYGEASGQRINFSKSSIMFGRDVQPQVKEDIKRVMGITQEGGMGTYLGLPEKVHGSKAQVFAFIQERLNSRVNAWSAKFLSKGGKEILIKSVAQALPTYVMSCFLLPKYICSKLSSAIVRFWWSKKNNDKGIHWFAWDKLSVPSTAGGLGFRSFEDFNLAFLAKQLWRLLRFPTSLLARVLRGRYFRYSNPLHVKPANNPSYGWRSIMASRPLLSSGLRRVIGSGMGTKVWSDPWIPDTPARTPKSLTAEVNPHLYVSDLIDSTSKQWKVDELRKLFEPEDISLILGIKPTSHFSNDTYSWSFSKPGAYSVRSGYLAAKASPRGVCDLPFQGPSVVALQAQAWKLPTSRKLMHFVWQIASGCIPSCQRLMERHIGQDKVCPRCGADEESINHVFFDCPPARQTWALSNIPSNPSSFPLALVFYNLDFLFWRARESGVEDNVLRTFPWILWFIWKARNLKVFENKEIPPLETLRLAEQEAESFRLANMRSQAMNVVREIQPDLEMGMERIYGTSLDSIEEIVCHIDGSWSDQDHLSGHGWIVFSRDKLIHLGLKCSRRSLSPLHAELDTLIWALRCLNKLQIPHVNIKTDCKDLILMANYPQDWPSFASELEDLHNLTLTFSSFAFHFMPRTLNVCADFLSKKARARGLIFSHVSSQTPDWFSLEENRILKA